MEVPEDRSTLFTEVYSRRMSSAGHKMKQARFWLKTNKQTVCGYLTSGQVDQGCCGASYLEGLQESVGQSAKQPGWPCFVQVMCQKPEVPLNLKDFMSCLPTEGFGPLKWGNFNLLILKIYIGNINVDLFLIKLMYRYVLPPRIYRM